MFASSECQGKRKKRLELKNYWKAYDWSVPNLSKDINLQTQESEQTPKRRNQKNIHTKTHHSQAAESKRQKKKKKKLKAAREKQWKQFEWQWISHQKLENGRKLHNIFQALKEMNCQPRIQYPLKTVFSDERDIKTYSEKGKLKILHQQTYSKGIAKRSSLNWNRVKEISLEQ